MTTERNHDRGVSRRKFLQAGAAGLAGGLLSGASKADQLPPMQDQHLPYRPDHQPPADGYRPLSYIYHASKGGPARNIEKVFDLAYGGIEKFIDYDDIVLLRPNLQWSRNGYTNSEIGKAVIDLILTRPGGFGGEIIVIENQHRSDPHVNGNSGWCTTDKLSNGVFNWFELIQYYIEYSWVYPLGIHTDLDTNRNNVTFQFLTRDANFTLEQPHPILPTYGGESYAGTCQLLDGTVDPFTRFKYDFPNQTCFYVRRSDIRYSSEIARVSPLNIEYEMSYPIFKSQHSGLYISLYKDHPTAWDPNTDSFTNQRIILINLSTLNHHGYYAGATSVVKGHFGMADRPYHHVGWTEADPRTFYYCGGAIGYWMSTIRQADLHMSCAERVGVISRQETDAYQAKSIAISKDPVALDYYVGKYILFPAGGRYGEGGSHAEEPWSNDPSLPGGYYGLTLEFCRDPLADHSIINGTLDEDEMVVEEYRFSGGPTTNPQQLPNLSL